MLVKMAKQYRRPLLVFYLYEVPRMGSRGEDFRKLSEPPRQVEVGLVDAVIRDIRVRQLVVKACIEAAGEQEELPFIGSKQRKQGVRPVAAAIERTLYFDRDAFRGKANSRHSFAYLRQLAEDCGIFVLLVDNLGSWHTTIDVEAFRGFALADTIAPFVAVNANDSPSAWSFTLLHELAHMWLGETGMSGGQPEFDTERFCNDVASELLLPADELAPIAITGKTPVAVAMAQIDEFAKHRKVSSTMVAYKLYRTGVFDFKRYQQLADAYRKAFLDYKAEEKGSRRDQKGGPNYYITRKHRVGKALLRFVDRMMHEGYLSPVKAGKALGVKAHSVYALL